MGTIGAIAAAQRARQMREIASHLREQKALSAANPAPVRPQGRMGQWALRSMVKDGSVVSKGGDLYWLDETAYAAARKKRATGAVWIIGLALLLIGAILVASLMSTHEL